MNSQSIYSSHKVFTELLLYSQPSDELLIFSSFALLPKGELEGKRDTACDSIFIKTLPLLCKRALSW